MNILDFKRKIEKIKSLIESDNKPFDLFCLIELKECEGCGFDIVVSNEWLDDATNIMRKYIHDNLQDKDLINILRIVTLSNQEPFYKETKALEANFYENIVICGMDVKKIYVL